MVQKIAQTEPIEAPKKKKRVVFKTLGARVNFVVNSTVLLLAIAVTGIAVYFTYYSGAILPGYRSYAAVAAVAVVTIASLWLSKKLGNYLITRRVKKLVAAVQAVVTGQAGPETLPAGLSELDDITTEIEEIATELVKTRATMEKNVKLRTSVLEISKEMTELDKARTDALLGSIGEGVIATDVDGKISFLNNVAKEALWWNPEAVINVPIHDAFRLEDEKENVIDEKDWPTVSVLNGGEKIMTPSPIKPFYLRRQDKSRFPVKMTICPVGLRGETAGILATFDDITDEVNFDRRKSEFISIASHELRSPASALKMMTDMMRGGDLGPMNDKQRDWMNKIFIASDHLLDLVSELLNISRLEAGVEAARETQDLTALIQNVMIENEPLLSAKNQSFSFGRTEAIRLPFDKFMIGEVVKNFITNANKYSPEGGTITLAVDKSTNEIKVSVTDQGIGIPKSDHKQMFNKFFRAENALKSAIVGTGLGLYYCKTVVEKHGGRIGFDSTVGKGSTFWFTLPMKR